MTVSTGRPIPHGPPVFVLGCTYCRKIAELCPMRTILLTLLVAFATLPLAAQSDETPQLQPKLHVGDKAPLFAGKDQSGTRLISKELAMDGPIVLVFYRGVWCPYCEKYVSELQQNLEQIAATGARVVLVTPEQPDYAKELLQKTNSSFSVITDSDYAIMNAYGVAFTISKATVPRAYDYVKKHTRESNGNEDDVLPVPATFVISKQHTVLYQHFDTDYRNRAPVSDILKALKQE